MKALLLFLFICVGCESAHKTVAPSPAAKVATQSFTVYAGPDDDAEAAERLRLGVALIRSKGFEVTIVSHPATGEHTAAFEKAGGVVRLPRFFGPGMDRPGEPKGAGLRWLTSYLADFPDVSSETPPSDQGTSDDEPDSEPPVAAAAPSQEAAPPTAPQVSVEPSSEPSRTGLTVQGVEVRTDNTDKTQVFVVWTEPPPSAGVTHYRVEYKEGTHPADPFTRLGGITLGRTMSTNKVTTTVGGLRPGTTYTVRVTALRGGVNGTELGHGEATGRTRDAFGPVTAKAVPGYGDKLDVSWPGLGDGISYTVEYRRTRTAEMFIVFTRADTSATTERITGLVHNTDYTVRVRARFFVESEVNPEYEVVGEAQATAITSFPKLQPPEPGAASGLSGWTLSGTGVSFDWKALDDVSGRNVTGYTIQWATDPNATSWTNADQSALSEKRCIPNMTVANYGYMREDTGDQQWVGCLYEYGEGTGWNLGDVRYFRLIAHTEGGADSDPGPIAKRRALP